MAESQAPVTTSESPTAIMPNLSTSAKQNVDPWDVQGEVGADGKKKGINYDALIDDFGTQRISPELLLRFEKVTGHKPHRFLRRGIVFSHRDLNMILDRYEKAEPFFLYTGRGPSSDSMHIGHTVPFDFTKYLQDVFDVPLVIMMTDDEKFLFNEKKFKKPAEVKKFTPENAKDIIACGFDPKKTFIFSDYDFMGGAFYENITRMARCITLNQAKACFGFDGSSNIGKVHFGAVQGASSFATSFPHIFGTGKQVEAMPCLIPCAIDQDPYFRLTRDVAPRLKYAKPALIHSTFLDALQGPGTKMSSSVDSSAIFMYDKPNEIKNKIIKYAFSGGKETAEEQRALGGDPKVDVPFQYLRFFLEDDKELERIEEDYKSGHLMTGELKAKCIVELQAYVKAFQERREKVTDEVVKDFFSKKELVYRGSEKTPVVSQEARAEGSSQVSKSQLKKIEKEKKFALQKAEKKFAKTAKAVEALNTTSA